MASVFQGRERKANLCIDHLVDRGRVRRQIRQREVGGPEAPVVGAADLSGEMLRLVVGNALREPDGGAFARGIEVRERLAIVALVLVSDGEGEALGDLGTGKVGLGDQLGRRIGLHGGNGRNNQRADRQQDGDCAKPHRLSHFFLRRSRDRTYVTPLICASRQALGAGWQRVFWSNCGFCASASGPCRLPPPGVKFA